MKKLFLLTILLSLSTLIFAQKDVVLNGVADKICSCLVEKGINATSNNLEQEIHTCFEKAIMSDIANLMTVYTLEDLEKNAEEIGEEVGLLVIKNCPSLYGGEVNENIKPKSHQKSTLDYNSSTIKIVSKISCECIEQLDESEAIESNKAIEKCINASMKKKKAKKALKKEFKTTDFDNETLLDIQNAVLENLENSCGDFVLLNKKATKKIGKIADEDYEKISTEVCTCLDNLDFERLSPEQLNSKFETCLTISITKNMNLFFENMEEDTDYEKLMEEVGMTIGVKLAQSCPSFVKFIKVIGALEEKAKEEQGEKG